MPIQMVNDQPDMFVAVVKVFGVGGGGGNAVEHMIDKEARGITFIAANTDRQALNRSRADIVIPLGKTGLGAGARPEVGEMAAKEAAEKIRESLEGTHLLFITAGMGGGTGTGAAPVIASIAREMGILTVAVVTKPFEFEGSRRMRQAQAGIENLKAHVDSMIVILNDKLEDEVGGSATIRDCFAAADEVLYRACNGIAEIIHTPGVVNVDFEDLRTVMSERGTAMMGTAAAAGPDRAREAAEKAIACPLLEGANLQGARGLLVYITASPETMSHSEVRQVMSTMTNFVSKDAHVIVGTAFDGKMGEELRVTVVATGLDEPVADDKALIAPITALRAGAKPSAPQPQRTESFSQGGAFIRSNPYQPEPAEQKAQAEAAPEPDPVTPEPPKLDPIIQADAQAEPKQDSVAPRPRFSSVPAYLRNHGGSFNR
jgi:cell division protein FtsZ